MWFADQLVSFSSTGVGSQQWLHGSLAVASDWINMENIVENIV